MQYFKFYDVQPDQADQGGQLLPNFYPYYMESCRQAFILEVLAFDTTFQSNQGIELMLSEFTIHYHRTLKCGDRFLVTCSLYADRNNQPKMHFKQCVILNGKAMATAIFTHTCLLKKGGRPFLTKELTASVALAPILEIS